MISSKKDEKPRIGLYSIGLNAYWEQFEGLKQRLESYNLFIERRLNKTDAKVYNFGLVDEESAARKAGEWFNSKNVDLIFCHCATYSVSAAVIPVHKCCRVPTVVLNLQPAVRVNYDTTTTGEWLAHCGACVAIELANAFERCGIDYNVVNGLLGLDETPECSLADETTADRPEAIAAWQEIREWVAAAKVKHVLKGARFGVLGNNYSGMLDLYSDYTLFESATESHVEILEMCDLRKCLKEVTETEIKAKLKEINDMFLISGDSPSESLAKKPTTAQLEWSASVAAAQERMVDKFGLDAIAYYYHGADGNEYEKLQGGFIVGHSLLTAKGIPCAGECDLKTALAMKICDILNIGGSYCEIVVVDYVDGTILLGHDGPFHIAIADGKPILRGMGIYHGKRGDGISVEAKVRTGDITNLGITQMRNGSLKMIIGEGYATSGRIMTIGNTQTPVKFSVPPDEYMKKWFSEKPTHHFAMSVGKNSSVLEKVAKILNFESVIL